METQLVLENGQPLIFGKDKDKGIVLNGSQLEVIQLGEDKNIEKILIHNTTDKNKARLLAGMTYNVDLPTPIGVIYEESKPTYDEMMNIQMSDAVDGKGKGNLDSLLKGTNTWTVS